MNINLKGLQENLVEEYNEVVIFLKKGREHGEVFVDGYQLEKLMRELHNSIVFVAGINDPETGDSYLDDAEVKVISFHAEIDED